MTIVFVTTKISLFEGDPEMSFPESWGSEQDWTLRRKQIKLAGECLKRYLLERRIEQFGESWKEFKDGTSALAKVAGKSAVSEVELVIPTEADLVESDNDFAEVMWMYSEEDLDGERLGEVIRNSKPA